MAKLQLMNGAPRGIFDILPRGAHQKALKKAISERLIKATAKQNLPSIDF